jgi:hypothetical protein
MISQIENYTTEYQDLVVASEQVFQQSNFDNHKCSQAIYSEYQLIKIINFALYGEYR